MAEIRLTTKQNIVKNTPMGGNVGVDKYIFLIDVVQKMILEPVLGTKLYTKVKEDYNTNILEGLYLQMHEDYIVPFLNYAVYANYVHDGSDRIVNNGNVRPNPSNTTTMTDSENRANESKWQNVANMYLNGLEKFLCHEANNIPEYRKQDEPYDKHAKNNEGYNLTWYL